MSVNIDTVIISLLMLLREHKHQGTNSCTTSQTYTVGIHKRTVLSLDAEATRCPDGENFTSMTASYREKCQQYITCTNKLKYHKPYMKF